MPASITSSSDRFDLISFLIVQYFILGLCRHNMLNGSACVQYSCELTGLTEEVLEVTGSFFLFIGYMYARFRTSYDIIALLNIKICKNKNKTTTIYANGPKFGTHTHKD